MSDKPIRCVMAVRSIPIELYKHPEDGQKWKQPAKNRRALLVELATYANPDGTFLRSVCNEIKNYSPSIQRLQKAGYARASLYRMMDSLHDLGLLTWDRKRHYDRREYTILIPQRDEKQVSDSVQSKSQTKENQTQNQVSDSEEKQVSYQEEPGLRSKPETQNQVSDSAKTGLIAGSTIRLLPSLESTATTNREENRAEAGEYFSKCYGQETGKPLPIPVTEPEEKELQALSDKHGRKLYGKVCRYWIQNRSLTELSRVAHFFIKEFGECLGMIEAQDKSSEDWKAYANQQAAARQQEIAQELAKIQRDKNAAEESRYAI